MKRKKVLLSEKLSEVIYVDDKVRISKSQSQWFFEIGNEITSDIAEAISILMRKIDSNHKIWEFEIDKNLDTRISPEKTLFWLTGGYMEWRSLENYNRPWCDCYLDFQEEFGFIIVNAVKRSNKFSEVRDSFIKYLNLPILYDFAVSRDFVNNRTYCWKNKNSST